jgi:iron complex outermembrane receptor protein
MPTMTRNSLRFSAAAAALLALSAPQIVHAQQATYRFDIPAQDLGSALRAYAQASHQQLSFGGETVRGRRSAAVVGEFPAEAALRILLGGGDLSYRRGAKGVLIIEAASRTAEGGDEPQAADDTAVLEELVVTATKREERLIDVPASIQAVSGAELQKLGAVNFSDYARSVAGVAFIDAGPGRTQIFIRGVSTGGDVDTGKEATVGIYVDETPVTEGSSQPDLKLYDIDRIEVLRGPQGTLYGSGSLGGTVRVLTRQPNFSEISGYLAAQGSQTTKGGTNGSIDGWVNIPLSDKVALRLVGYALDNSGFLDNGVTGAKDINDEQTRGARAALRIKPTERLNLVLTGVYQKSQIGAYYQVTDHFPGLVIEQNEPEPFTDRYGIVNLRAEYDFGPAILTSSTSYFDRKREFANDIDYFVEALTGVPRSTSLLEYGSKSFSEELRLASNGDGAFKWVVGAFYIDRDEAFAQTINFFGIPIPTATADSLFTGTTTSQTRQLAGFGEASWEFTPGLTLTGGLRISKIDREVTAIKDGLAVGGFSRFNGDFSETPITPKINLSYKPGRDSLIYAQAAKGFRIGGVNQTLPPCGPTCTVDVGPTFSSDSLWNYEVGAKVQLFDRALSINAAVFYIDWKDIQLNVNRGDGFNGFRNAGDAKSKGAELEANARLGSHVKLGGQVTYTKAELTSIDAGIVGVATAGDRLPDIPRWSASGNIEVGTTVLGDGWAYARADVQYVGSRYNAFQTDPLSLPLASYTLVNLRFGLQKGPWGGAIFVNNATDERAALSRLLAIGVRNGAPLALDRYTVNRPRTIGVSVWRNF